MSVEPIWIDEDGPTRPPGRRDVLAVVILALTLIGAAAL